MNCLQEYDFKKLASQQKSVQMKMRMLALDHFKDGSSRTQIAKYLKVTPLFFLVQKVKNPPLGGFFLMGPGSVLLSHGEAPHYHRR